MPDTSIVISARDNYSSNINRMREATRSFANDAEGLGNKLSLLDRTRASIRVDSNKARQELRRAEEEYQRLRDSGTSSAEEIDAAFRRMADANNSHETIRRNLGLVNNAIRDTERSIRDLDRTENRIENSSGGFSKSNLIKVGGKFASEMLAPLAQEATQYAISSAFSDSTGTIISSAISGAISGAGIGSMISPGVGTAIGIAAGGFVGAASGIISNQGNKDEYFKQWVQETISDVQSEDEKRRSSGSEIAAGREVDALSFKTLLGSAEASDEFLSQTLKFASKTPFSYDDITGMSKVLLSFKYNNDKIFPALKAVGDAGAALGMDSSSMKEVVRRIGQMTSSQKVSREYLDPLQERGIDVYGALSKEYNMSIAQVYDAVSSGKFNGVEVSDLLVKSMEDTFGGSMDEIAKTLQGLTSTLEDAQAELANAYGEGYNRIRKEGVQKEIDYLTGEQGERLQKAEDAIGEFQASEENKQELLVRQKKTIAMASEAYTDAEARGNVAEMGRLLQQAEIEARELYNKSEGAQILLASEKELAASVRESAALKEEYWSAGYEMGQEYTKGLLAGKTTDFFEYSDKDKNGKVIRSTQHFAERNHAVGINYVPYNGYNAVLHEGERVLTARENRNYKGTGNGVVISGNNFTVREEADIDKIARTLLEKIEQANLSYVG